MLKLDSHVLYALDIETDTSPCHIHRRNCGPDPRCAHVTEIAVVGQHFRFVIADEEETVMLRRLSHLLSFLPPGVIATWNGSVFDWPFLNTRYAVAGLTAPFALRYDSAIPVKYAPTPGYQGGCLIQLDSHEHVDIAHHYAHQAADLGVTHSLKPIAKAVLGIAPVVEDREHLHLLSAEQREQYALSDATITRELALHIGDPILSSTDFW